MVIFYDKMLSFSQFELEKSFENQTLKIEDVILEPSMIYAIKLNSQRIIQFLISNIHSIVSLAILQNRTQISDKAFQIISIGHHSIIKAISSSKIMNKIVKDLLSNPNPSEIALNRLSDILSYVFLAFSKDESESCEYLFLLLKRLDIIGIRNLFISLFSSHRNLIDAQENFLKMNLIEKILNELFTIDLTSISFDDFSNPLFLKIESIYNILESAAYNSIFHRVFIEPSMMNCLLQHISGPNYVISAQWRVIEAIFSKLPESCYQSFIEPANSIIVSLKNKIFPYHCSALKILTICLKETTEFVTDDFIKHLLASFISFDQCTDFHRAVRDFIINALKDDSINLQIVLIFAPVLLVEAQIREYVNIASSAFIILDAMNETISNNADIEDAVIDIDGLQGFMKTDMKRYQEILSRPYGMYELDIK